MKQDPVPIEIRRASASVIEIEFDDGKVVRWNARKLRDECPCATCREQKRGDEIADEATEPFVLPVISAAQARPLTIEGMRPVGQYGYNIQFSDGHTSGIFQFEALYAGSQS